MKPNQVIQELYKISLYVTTKKKKAEKLLSEVYDPENVLSLHDVDFGATLTSGEDRLIVVYFGKYFKEVTLKEQIAVIAHEAQHCVQRITSMINEDEPSIEFEAYLMEYLTKYILEETKILEN